LPLRVLRNIELLLRFWQQYGVTRGLLRGLIELTNPLYVPKCDMIVALKGELKMFLRPYDYGISTELRRYKTHEPLFTHVLSQFLKTGSVVIDVGSNLGYYALLESKLVGRRGLVIAIEPEPINFSYLIRNLRLNRITNVVPVNLAVSNINGTIMMVRSKKSNQTFAISDQARFRSGRYFLVKAKTLDCLVERMCVKVDAIRADIEGYEDFLLLGAVSTIRKFRPVLLLEIHPFLLGVHRTFNMLMRLKELGYVAKVVIPRKIDFALVCRKDDILTNLDMKSLTSGPLYDGFNAVFVAI